LLCSGITPEKELIMRSTRNTLIKGSLLAAALCAGPAVQAKQDPQPMQDDSATKSTKSPKHEQGYEKQPSTTGKSGDNTGKNAGDSTTAQQQGNSKTDVELTAKIRRAIMSDKNLSTSAHNVKIITQSGVVTLKGPVKSAEERTTVAAKAKELAGDMNVKNELDVAP